MSTEFSDVDIINIAINIERRGISFYDVMAKSADSQSARAIFEELVELEREHLEMFQKMLDEFDDSQTVNLPSNDRFCYIKSLIESAIFTDDMITGDMASQADTDIKAIELGINAEKDSLLFYYEIKDILPQRMAQLINRIIAEEKNHLLQLASIKGELT
jgi:rubrerythrin